MNVLIKPIITEKMTADSELYNRYGFIVDPRANKIQIKDAVEATYGVSVKKVRTMNYGPSRKTRYTKTGIQHGKTNAIKKAVVDVVEGDIIDFYSNL
ncbi:50S ribosomal protein L23 [Zobellia galactanivorans]|uniref:Large ribosomal subunit protein uL23 n=2 Tax=Zobellia TaxID=112040 RepID=G0L620_ZOBGA|nr:MULTISPECIES: 50S ribosomal protein L23 [Zobellia]MBU3027715.1 50S ribosomal protein L23 [Zobellia galactanivorans]MDO6517593.1 50S ribosomal protein L23 [Zobellia uliginosa]MDO6807096.1 50S ribosomal protein L23 [Zobellia galactanivorans]OWW23998.1 50S ribosomal protein L23 [Zobellia sp. OII3]CAZ96662.1 Ribosomal protein L23 [Zobellia galactanivorans]